MSVTRSRWAAIGAAVAVSLGAGSIGLVQATTPSDALTYVAITACRVTDTRPAPDNVGPRTSPLGQGDTHTIRVHGSNGKCTGIPTTATAVSLNVTALNATHQTFLTVWGAGEPRPVASSLNPAPGQPPVPNAVTTQLDAAGRFNIYNAVGSVNVIADITGYYVDHHHDDRYYTKGQANARFALANPIDDGHTFSLFDFWPDDPAWSLSGGWRHNGTNTDCIFASFDAPEGTAIESYTITYRATVPASVRVVVASLRRTAGPGGTDAAVAHLINNAVNFPVTPGGSFETIVVPNDPADIGMGIAYGPIRNSDWDPVVSLCPSDPITFSNIELNYG